MANAYASQSALKGHWSRFQEEVDKLVVQHGKLASTGDIHIWTMQLVRWRFAKANDIAILDVTAKSGIQDFAPLYPDVMAYKRGEMSELDYTKIYLDRMTTSLQRRPMRWIQLADAPRVAVTCYCRPGVFCHRHLFKELMTIYLTTAGFTVKHEGEFMAEAISKS